MSARVPPYNLAVLNDAITRLPANAGLFPIEYAVNERPPHGPFVLVYVNLGDRQLRTSRVALDDRCKDFEDAFRLTMFGAVIELIGNASLNIDDVYRAFGHPIPTLIAEAPAATVQCVGCGEPITYRDDLVRDCDGAPHHRGCY